VVGITFIAVAVKKLKNVHFSILQFYYSAFTAVVMGNVLFARYMLQEEDSGVSQNRVPLVFQHTSTYFILTIACLLNMIATSFMTCSTQRSKPSTVALICYTGIIYNFLLDVFVFRVTFSTLQLFGIGIVCAFNVGTVVHKQNNEAKAKEAETTDDYQREGNGKDQEN